MSVTVPYFTQEMQKVVLRSFGLPLDSIKKGLVMLTNSTDVEKTNEKLVCLHYNPDKLEKLIQERALDNDSLTKLANMRGVIYDLEDSKILVKSFPRTVSIYTNSVPTDHLYPINVNGQFKIPSFGTYKKRYGGALLRIFWHKGVARASTHKKIDAINSFFGDSDKFSDIFLNDQDVFSSFESIYDHSDTDIVHLFIINNEKLIVDSRDKNRNSVVYIKSISMSDPSKICDMTYFITEKNKSSSKPITICEEYSPLEVNRVLQGKPVYEPSENTLLNGLLNNFAPGESIIYENEFGIYSIVPSSCSFRQRIMEGTSNVSKIFTDAVADYERNSKGFIKIGFSLESLSEIADLLEAGEPVNLNNYTQIEGKATLCVLTNLIFVVPISRIRECFVAYSEFNEKIREAILLIIERKEALYKAVCDETLKDYAGMRSMGTFFKKYVSEKIVSLRKQINGPHDNWSDSAKELFEEYYAVYCDSQDEMEKYEMNERMGVVSMISNATDSVLYSFITYKKKIEKEAEAMSKRATSAV